MIFPIIAYGDPILRKKTETISADFQDLNQLIEDMFQTMYHSNGVGLAAPQIGKSVRLFVADTALFADDEDLTEEERFELLHFKKVFINPEILQETGTPWAFCEGCLSIPGINEDVKRPEFVTIKYQDADFQWHTETYSGLIARVIQHEYDHLQGVLFTDKISPFKRRILNGKLNNISKGKVNAKYKMRFFNTKKKS